MEKRDFTETRRKEDRDREKRRGGERGWKKRSVEKRRKGKKEGQMKR